MVLKPKKNLYLRKIGRQHIIVDAREGSVNMSDVFSLNETAAALWQKIGEGDYTPEQLADWMCGEYDVERSVALADIEKQLADWQKHGLVV